MAKKRSNGYKPPIYQSYMFRDKDPVIDELRSMVEDTYGHRVNHKSLAAVTQAGGPSISCMNAWFFGKTKRPVNPTIEAAGRAMGFKRKWVRMTASDRE